ncbi:MAG: Photosystem I reaction center subunit IX [Synechococcales bacterium]|jgi:photosystem I subunit 9|nr:Photosystem I reaction center subunit IX [Cyanobacteria bacterium REEB444]MEB3125676.1 Photosystem I reaction center subunit IX [Synechococcales bacterium]NBO32218.1 Photosystem I reaction center subunit IX [Cyanobacteria bacterium WB6_1B_304]
MAKFLSLSPVILFLWLAQTSVWLIVFNYIFPDLLFHPL